MDEATISASFCLDGKLKGELFETSGSQLGGDTKYCCCQAPFAMRL